MFIIQEMKMQEGNSFDKQLIFLKLEHQNAGYLENLPLTCLTLSPCDVHSNSILPFE
jgi:hypothetical protein